MFKYQDLLYLKEVHLPYQSQLTEWITKLVISNSDGEVVLEEDSSTNKVYKFAKTAQTIMQDMIVRSSSNREWQLKRIEHFENLLDWGEDSFPVQYDVSGYFAEYSNTEDDSKNHPVVKPFIQKFYEASVKECYKFHGENAEREVGHYRDTAFLDEWNGKFVDIVNDNKLYFARPPYKNTWINIGKLDDKNFSDNQQGVHIQVYNYDEWNDYTVFDREHNQDRKFILENDKEFVVCLTAYMNVNNEIGFKDSEAYIHMDEDHALKDFHQTYVDDDILDQYIKKMTLSMVDNELEQNEECKVLANNIVLSPYTECMYSYARTYILLELFNLMNTKSRDLPKDETVLVSDVHFTNTKKASKRLKSKIKKDVPASKLEMKVLVVNPLLNTVDAQGNVTSMDMRTLREHQRAGHTKTYLPSAPRFGVHHPNNIGTFWINPSVVKKDSKKGKIVKDYKVEL